jgi:hypothetical protein
MIFSSNIDVFILSLIAIQQRVCRFAEAAGLSVRSAWRVVDAGFAFVHSAPSIRAPQWGQNALLPINVLGFWQMEQLYG